jgi:hypothetical protein
LRSILLARITGSVLADLACSPDDAPYVAERVMFARLPGLDQHQLSSVRDRMKTAQKSSTTEGARERLAGWLTGSKLCSGAVGFTERHWRWLEEIKTQ